MTVAPDPAPRTVAEEARRFVAPAASGLGLQEMARALPPPDDLGATLGLVDHRYGFLFGDGGDRRLRLHLWDRLLATGLDRTAQASLRETGFVPASLAGPLPLRAGLELQAKGAFSAVLARAGDSEVRLLGGELLCGGHQDRMVADDVRLHPGEETIIPAWSVEGGRTQGSSEHLHRTGVVAPPSLRAGASNQFRLWARIARHLAAVETEARSLAGLLQSDPVADTLAASEATWIDALSEEECTGAVLVLDGEPVAADLFDDPAQFARHRSSLVRSYLAEGILRSPTLSPDSVDIFAAGSLQGRGHLSGLVRQAGAAEGVRWHWFLFQDRRG